MLALQALAQAPGPMAQTIEVPAAVASAGTERPQPQRLVLGTRARVGSPSVDSVIYGEIVIANADGSSDFGALQQRLGVGRRDADTSGQQMPAVLLAFDVLRCGGAELAAQPLRDRRAILERLLAANPAGLQLIAQTDWLRLVPNIECVVAKRWDGRYSERLCCTSTTRSLNLICP